MLMIHDVTGLQLLTEGSKQQGLLQNHMVQLDRVTFLAVLVLCWYCVVLLLVYV